MKQEESYIIKEIDMAQPKPQWVRAMVCQMKFQDFSFDQDGRLLIIRNSLEIRHIVLNLMNVALNNNVNIIVFPELSIPQLLIGEITKIARQGNMFVFAGTRYKKENDSPEFFSRRRNANGNQSESHHQKAQYKQHNTYHDQSSHKLRINDTITMNGLRQHTAQCPLILLRIDSIESQSNS